MRSETAYKEQTPDVPHLPTVLAYDDVYVPLKGANVRWCVIEGYPNYQISDRGTVRGPRGVLKPWLQKRGGYPAVRLSKGTYASQKNWCVHTLVANAFLGPKPTSKHEVCHRDSNPTNNRVSNIYWGTRADNVRDAMNRGTAFNVGRDGGRWSK